METAVGCDVGKKRIDVACTGGFERCLQVDNEPQAIERLARMLPAGSIVGMEATNTYHERLAEALVAAGHRVFVINPRWIRAYARGLGMRGKSDRTDAAVIARYVGAEHRHLHPYRVPTPQQAELRTLLQRRRSLAKLAAQAAQSLGSEAEPLLEQLQKMLKQVDRAIGHLITSNPEWKTLAARLRNLPGVGAQTAAQLVATLTRLPFPNVDSFIAHTGTDPRPNDSGQSRGRRRLSHHGNGHLRILLFMAAMTASRKPEWRAIYEAQRAKGLSSTAAFVVIARKLARIAYSLFKSGQDYDPSHIGSPGTA